MSTRKILVAERSRDLGNFLVGRLLPFREKRLVGPFCFIDHMGPSEFGNGTYFDVDQHPHIGLCTLTYLIEGAIMHQDSTGAKQRILPGSVNLMVSGRGVTHTERTPDDLRNGKTQTIHGYQVWIALPVSHEEAVPSFTHIAAEDLPRWEENGLQFTLVAGEGYGRKSPTPVFSPLFMVDVSSTKAAELCVSGKLKGEIAIVVVKGSVTDGETEVNAGQMLISKVEDECTITLAENSQVLLFGGEPLPEQRFMFWNFISHSKERLEQAKTDWRNRTFPKVPDDDTYVPLP